jgi:pimeloyl-ACP methyl ester carboxylesterase
MRARDMSVVLVHGAWADGSSWAKVISALQAAGHKVLAAPLPLTSFEADVASVEQTLERAPGPVVLVAHAYAGAVIAATTADEVKALVYICALAPAEGETVADVFHRVPPHPRAPQLAPDRHGRIYLPEAAFGEAFAPNATPGEQALLAAVQRPIAPACISTKLGRPRWHGLPSWFLIARQDRMILSETQQFMAGRMQARVRAHEADHMPLVTAPQRVVDIIEEAAAAVAVD